jgi:hypothetical protein
MYLNKGVSNPSNLVKSGFSMLGISRWTQSTSITNTAYSVLVGQYCDSHGHIYLHVFVQCRPRAILLYACTCVEEVGQGQTVTNRSPTN